MRRNRAGDRVGQSRNSHIAKQLPKGRQWIGQVVHRKDAAWGKDWFPGKVCASRPHCDPLTDALGWAGDPMERSDQQASHSLRKDCGVSPLPLPGEGCDLTHFFLLQLGGVRRVGEPGQGAFQCFAMGWRTPSRGHLLLTCHRGLIPSAFACSTSRRRRRRRS